MCPQALPVQFTPRKAFVLPPDTHAAYQRVVAAEQAALQAAAENVRSDPSTTITSQNGLNDRLLCLRVLGYSALEASDAAGLAHLIRAILFSDDDQGLVVLGRFYLKYFVRRFYKATGSTPAPSEHPSRPSSKDDRDHLVLQMRKGSLSHREVKLLALERDSGRCVISGAYSRASVILPAAEDHYNRTRQPLSATKATLIVPRFLHNFSENELADPFDLEVLRHLRGDDPESDRKRSNMWAMLRIFGSERLVELEELNIHRMENVFTCQLSYRAFVECLQLWFEPTDEPNTYRVCVSQPEIRPFRFVGFCRTEPVTTVTFPSTPDLPPPSPDYLALHATCCRIAVLSGAADHFAAVKEDFEDFREKSASPRTAGVIVDDEAPDTSAKDAQDGTWFDDAVDLKVWDQQRGASEASYRLWKCRTGSSQLRVEIGNGATD
ncbi:hypothetical protein C8J57DRAFT_1501661 [Mycena rebaudengoi]|nr:hypothetical protein C8J57DRAFT_1501661 [Mycena rebaudengoi]